MKYTKFCDTVRSGILGKTAQFWMSYLDNVSLMLNLLRAIKTNNFNLYEDCLSSMSRLFFRFGGHNYARYLTFFSVYISNLELTHPDAVEQIKFGVLSVAS